MNSLANKLVYAALLALFVSLAYGLDYLYLTDEEMTSWGERIKFRHGDTLDGIVRSNSQIAIAQNPVFYDHVITTANDFWHGIGYDPQFLGPPPTFNAPPVFIPMDINTLRSHSNYFLAMEMNKTVMLDFRGGTAYAYTWERGTPFDSSDFQIIQWTDHCRIFSDSPIRVKGRITGQVTVGSSSSIEIEDDIRYSDSDSLTGITPATSTNFLALASGGDIKIRNTPANGRENSNGLGYNQTDHRFTSIVITAALYALGGGFTFENQNDTDSGYVCDCTPDDRGTIYLYGGVVQRRRGYLHRSTRNSTGYMPHFRFDSRLRFWNDGVLNPSEYPTTPDTLDFGDIVIGATEWDTLHVVIGIPSSLGAVYATSSFHALRIDPLYGTHFVIPVSITPTQARIYWGVLNVSTSYHYYQIVLRARGVPGMNAAPIDLTAYPNPFNLSTMLRYSISEPGPVKIVLYDVLGREAQRFESFAETVGEHSVQIDASNLGSGVCFAHLTASGQRVTQKLLLVK
jgi:hypothetical protein